MDDKEIYPYVDFGSDKVLYLMLGPGHGYVISGIGGTKLSEEDFNAIDNIIISPNIKGRCFDCETILGDGICPDCHNDRLLEDKCDYCRNRS